MTEVRLKYLHSFSDRHGHVRFYFRYRGNRWPLPASHEELLAELETMPCIADTIIVGDRGNPVTAACLSRMVRLKLRGLGVTGYSIHGLRKNAGNEIAEAGGTEPKSWSGLAIKLRRWPPINETRQPRKVDAVRCRKAGAGESVESGKPKNETCMNKWQPH